MKAIHNNNIWCCKEQHLSKCSESYHHPTTMKPKDIPNIDTASDSADLNGTVPNIPILEYLRYKTNPIFIFFECYIEDTIGFLPEEKSKTLHDMNLQRIFSTKASDWRAVIRETLRLSDTIDIAIQDSWYQNRGKYIDDQGYPDAFLFSQVFSNEFMEDGSMLDVWSPGALDAAKERIRRAKEKDMALCN